MFLWKIVDVLAITLFLKVYVFFSSLIAACAKVNALLFFKMIIVGFESFIDVLALLVSIAEVMLLHWLFRPFNSFRPFRRDWKCNAGTNLPFRGFFSL